MKFTRTQKLALLALSLIGVALVAYFAYTYFTFRVVSTEPGKDANVGSSVVFTFNKDLANPQDIKFKVSPNIPGNVTISGRKVTFKPSESYKLNTTYVATIDSITARNGSKLTNIKTTFRPSFVSEADMSEDDRNNLVNQTDKLEKENTILTKLPYTTNEFKVDYDVIQDAEGNETLILRVTLFAILNRSDQYNTYVAQLNEYKSKSVAWIEQNSGGKIYSITFTPDIPQQSQPGNDYTGDGAPPEEQPH